MGWREKIIGDVTLFQFCSSSFADHALRGQILFSSCALSSRRYSDEAIVKVIKKVFLSPLGSQFTLSTSRLPEDLHSCRGTWTMTKTLLKKDADFKKMSVKRVGSLLCPPRKLEAKVSVQLFDLVTQQKMIKICSKSSTIWSKVLIFCDVIPLLDSWTWNFFLLQIRIWKSGH